MGAALFDELQKEGWHIKSQVQGALLQELDSVNIHLLRQHLLNSDFKKVGHVCIPDAVNKANATFQGPIVLQVASARDITRPEKGVASDTGKRMMFLTLTDGRSTCRCLEYKHVSSLSDAMPPGTKILLRNATVKAGVIILDTKSIQVLGGRVDALAEAWEIERKFGSSRPKGDDEEMAPAFKHFDPRRTGRHNKGQSHGAKGAPPVGPSSTAAVLSGQNDEEEEEVVRQVDVSAGSAPISSNQNAVKAKLLGDMKPDFGRRRGQGFGGPQDSVGGPSSQGGRGGRHGHSRGDDPGTLTLEEYEARKKGKGLMKPRVQSDEELARKLHEELNMTASNTPPLAPPKPKTAANDLLSNLFSYGGDPEPEFDTRGRRGGRGHVGAYDGRGGRGPLRGRGGSSRGRGRGGGGGRGRGGGGRRGRRG